MGLLYTVGDNVDDAHVRRLGIQLNYLRAYARSTTRVPAHICRLAAPLTLCDETWAGVNGADYRGCQNTTNMGVKCQAWSSQSPQTHTAILKYPNSGLTSNFCRNPDEDDTIW
jgi:hypothetical protein